MNQEFLLKLFFLTAHAHDISAFHGFIFQIPSGIIILADKEYNDYPLEDSLMERGIHLMPLRKKKLKRTRGGFVENGIKFIRKRIESAFSVIKQRFPTHASRCHALGIRTESFPVRFSIWH